MLQSDQIQVFADRILQDPRHEQAKSALIFIQEQHKDIIQVTLLFFH